MQDESYFEKKLFNIRNDQIKFLKIVKDIKHITYSQQIRDMIDNEMSNNAIQEMQEIKQSLKTQRIGNKDEDEDKENGNMHNINTLTKFGEDE